MLYRLGKLTVRYRWPILIVWLALLVAAAPFVTRALRERSTAQCRTSATPLPVCPETPIAITFLPRDNSDVWSRL